MTKTINNFERTRDTLQKAVSALSEDKVSLEQDVKAASSRLSDLEKQVKDRSKIITIADAKSTELSSIEEELARCRLEIRGIVRENKKSSKRTLTQTPPCLRQREQRSKNWLPPKRLSPKKSRSNSREQTNWQERHNPARKSSAS